MKNNTVILFLILMAFLSSCGNQKADKKEPGSDKKTDGTSIISSTLKSTNNLVTNPGFENLDLSTNLPEGWSTKISREEIAPAFEVDKTVSRSGKFSARISAKGSPGTFGYFITSVKGIQPETAVRGFSMSKASVADTAFLSSRSFRVTCYFKVKDIESLSKSVWIRVIWLDKKGQNVFEELISSNRREGDWYRVEQVITAPKAAADFNLELTLQWTATGTVWWDDICIEETTTPKERWVKLASSNSAPSSPSTSEKNRLFYAEKIIEAGKLGVDILCLGEGITVVSTGKKYAEVAEPVPGPTSRILGEAARKAKLYVVAGIYEREGSLVYNTALLIDRNGNIAGKYRKTHLPQTEVYGGITPGTEYPVFQTDFGTVGIEICYDNFFPEVVRNLAINGAEIILLPIWGDIREQGYVWDIVARSRAIDNSIYLVASMYGRTSNLIFTPTGRIIEDTDHRQGLLTAKILLNTRTFEPWLSVGGYGEFKNLFPLERRGETYDGLMKGLFNK
jgi:predicted amidohydrolase